ncbi:hypothetical protein [Sulfurimonas sp.]|uniref:hypothetical protein n=1 Tax=Sulfurimonas sp. TaxID=2022749 RepID=UPI0035618E0B
MNSMLSQHIKNKTEYIEEAKKLYLSINQDLEKVHFIEYLLNFLIKNVTEYMSDSFLENELNKISDSIHSENNIKYIDGNILHVMTEAYGTGGHTRLAELFIKNISSNYKQDILLTRQGCELPSIFTNSNILDKKIILKDDNIFDKSKILFEIASKYQYVILHTHKDDVLVNLTFGTKKFKRPVLFVNHADHAFWSGGSVADLVLELSTEGMEFSKSIRGIKNNRVINIPIEEKKVDFSKKEARKKLSIDNDKKIILSIGTEYKYGSTEEEVKKFIDMAKNIVNNVDKCEFVLIGPSRQNKFWNEAYEFSNGKINPIGMQSRESLELYIIASDLYIESFPFSSYSAYLEVLSLGLSALTLKNEIFSLDVVKRNNMECSSIKEIEEKAINILNNAIKNEKDFDIQEHLKEKWSENIISIIDELKYSKHDVYNIQSKKASIEYLNHTDKVIGNSLGLNFTYKKLPFFLKIKLGKLMIKYNIIRNFFDFVKLIERIVVIK